MKIVNKQKKTRENIIPLDTFVGEPSNKTTCKGLGMILTYVYASLIT